MNRFEESKEVYNKLFGELPDANTEINHELMEILRRFINQIAIRKHGLCYNVCRI